MWGSGRQLRDYLGDCQKRALDDLAMMDPDDLLSENLDVIVAALLGRHAPSEIVVDWNGATRSPVTEVTTQVRDEFDHDRRHTVAASKITVSYPISGTTEMLDYQASTYSLSGRYGKVTRGAVVVEVVERELTTEVIRARIDQAKRDIDQRILWANGDLLTFRRTADQAIRSAYERRKQRVLSDREVEASLDIPVRTSTVPRPPVVARRRQVALQARREQAGFVPEPVLDEAIYQDVLEVVRSWANSLERTPGTADKLDEEELRDLLLGNLNGYWQGAAGGELFNGNGKTDILIREGDRNAFIAECKIWRGPKGVADAVNQLALAV